MHAKDLCTKQCILSTIGIVLLVFGGVFAIFWLDFFQNILAKEMKLGPNTKSYEIWKSPPITMSLDIYFFNWTNPTNFTAEEFEKPILKELGPYRFTEITDKTQIRWHPENSTVSFRKKSDFYFDAEGSNGSLDDQISTLNIVALSAATKALYWPFVKQKSVSIGLSLYHQESNILKTARELIFEGYNDDLIDIAREVSFFGDEKLEVPFDKFGWFYMRNGTDNQTGHYNMHTGEDDISQIGVVKNWNYSPRTEFFPDNCGLVNGSAGEFYSPKQRKDKSVSFYSPDMCRIISLDYSNEEIVEGIHGYKYKASKKLLDNGSDYPENQCFSNGQIVPSGVMNVSSCRFGTPVFMSLPHYYEADSFYRNQVEGLNPSKDKHEFYMILEPMTGIALDVAARFQINMYIRPIPNVAMYQEAPHLFFPVIWFEQKVRIPADMATEIRTVLSVPATGFICIGVIMAIGLVLLLWLPTARFLRKNNPIKSSQNGINEKIAPEGSPLMASNGKLKNVEMIRTIPKDQQIMEKLAPLAEKET